ncbi:helix-turn-helix domain-containing protein [Castellaniella caeni]|uniref:helix-turn-helix domain-containing protein n=1 Tax=Castellaniella caeni TaxID=266123 RepID=UPI000C9FF8D7|nr:GAF domain-containing protein [Castellaniella caeni]
MAKTSLTSIRTARSLWRAVVGLLHRGANREQFTELLTHARQLAPGTPDREDLIHCIELAQGVKERLDLHQQRERGLLAVLESAQDLTAITDPDRILLAIVQRARKLMGCDVGYLSIYDPQQGAFYVRATDGAFSQNFKRVRVPLDVGICGFVARHKVPYASSDYGSDSRFPHTPGIDSAVTEENITSILGVPLLASASVTGVLFVGDRYVRTYTPWEKHILSVLAAHAALALNNAQLFEQTQAALRQASDTNQQLARHTAEADRAARAHERLTVLAARGGNVQDICQMAASILGGAVTAYDSGDHEIARAQDASQTVPDAAGPVSLDDRLHHALQDSRLAGRSVSVPGEAGAYCRIAAATGGLGGLMIRTAQPLRDADIRTFERSAMLASVVLLSRQQRESIAQTDMSSLVRSLIGSPDSRPELVTAQASRLGLDLASPLQLILLGQLNGKASHLARDLASTAAFQHCAIDAGSDTLALLANSQHVRALLAPLAEHTGKALRHPMTAVLSQIVSSADALRPTHHRLQACLRILSLLHSPPRLFLEQELSAYTLLLAHGRKRQDVLRYLHASLGALYQPDDTRKQALAHTLLTYLDAGHNAAATATALDIHLNTVHQRLTALDHVLSDWRLPARRLDIHMALRLWQLDGKLTPD